MNDMDQEVPPMYSSRIQDTALENDGCMLDVLLVTPEGSHRDGFDMY